MKIETAKKRFNKILNRIEKIKNDVDNLYSEVKNGRSFADLSAEEQRLCGTLNRLWRRLELEILAENKGYME